VSRRDSKLHHKYYCYIDTLREPFKGVNASSSKRVNMHRLNWVCGVDEVVLMGGTQLVSKTVKFGVRLNCIGVWRWKRKYERIL